MDHSEAELPDRSAAAVAVSLRAGAGPCQDRMSGDLAPPWSAACQAQASRGTWLGTVRTPHPTLRWPDGRRAGCWEQSAETPLFQVGFVTPTSWTLPATVLRVASTALSMASCPMAPWKTASTSR